MLRQLVNVVRYALQAARNNIKPLILIASFLTFIWLIVDTAHRPEFVRHASKHSFQHNQTIDPAERWDQRSVQRFLNLLEIVLDINTSSTQNVPLPSCQPDKPLLLTAFAGSSLREQLWHYFSLIALQGVAIRSRIMLTGTTRDQLGELFISVPFEVINEDTIACYDISAACILNDSTSIELLESDSQVYIVNNNAKRLREILEVSWEDQAVYFQFASSKQRVANDMLTDQRELYESEYGDASVQFVGINIGEDDDLPFEYYYRAIAFQRKMHDIGQLLFVVLCQNPNGAICSALNVHSEHINIVRQTVDHGVNFALMTLCNHTIVSSESDIFPALVRSRGNTVVYGHENVKNRNAGVELANYKDNWYTIV